MPPVRPPINPSRLAASVLGTGIVGPNLPPLLVPDDPNWPLTEGTIHHVDIDAHTCVVVTDTGCTLPDVSWASPMFTCVNGGGIYIMPEVMSRVVAGRMSNGMWYVLGYLPMFAEHEGYSTVNGRKDLQQGDIMFCTPTGTSIEIRKLAEQIVLRDGPNFIFMETTGNRISTHSERMTVRTNAGVVTMETDAQFRTTTTAYLKRKVDDEKNFVKIIAGYMGNTNGVPDHGALPKNFDNADEVILQINVCDKFKLSVDTSGNLKISANSITQEALKHISRTSGDVISDNAVVTIEHTKASGGGIGGDLGGSAGNQFAEFSEPPASYPHSVSAGAPGSEFSVGRDRLGLGGNGSYGGSGGYGGDDATYKDKDGYPAPTSGFSAPATPVPSTPTTGGLTGADKIIDHTAIFEGSGKYDAWTANDNGHGVSYGLIQFNQETGSMPTLLARMRAANPEKFDDIMGPYSSNMMNEGWVRSANLNNPDIKQRMLTAARDPEFQAVQRSLAKEGYFDFTPTQASKYMGVSNPSERTLAMLFDSNVQNGPNGTSGLLKQAVQAVGKDAGERAIMQHFAQLADAKRYSNGRRTKISRDGAFSDAPFSG